MKNNFKGIAIISILLNLIILYFTLNTHLKLLKISDKVNTINIKTDSIIKNTKDEIVEYNYNEFPPALDFSLKNSLGEEVTLLNFNKTGKKLFIFTDKDCEACKGIYKVVNEFTISYPSIEVVVFQLNTKIKDAKEFLTKNKYVFEILVASEKTFRDYMIQGTPSGYVIDKDNNVVAIADGFENKKNLEDIMFSPK